MGKIIGIDLGTTNSCVAVVEAFSPRVLANRDGSRTTPSIVAFTPDNDRLVGQIAKRQAITNPQQTVYAVKRLIGRKFSDPNVQRARDVLPYALVDAPNGDVKVQIRDRQHSPEEISAFVLRELKAYAEETTGEAVKEAIITVPAYFDDSQRQATKDAGRIAGLEVLRILNEPTAAALAYGLDRGTMNRKIAVYDLGGGTFDISILELSEGIFEVRSTSGDTYLGGEDFDQKIIDWLIVEFRNETGIDLRGDRMALQRLKEAAERAKCELSAVTETTINLPFISADEKGPRHLSRVLTRPAFEELVADLVARTEGPCRDAIDQAGLAPEEIDEVLLVGGQTRTPLVAQTVERIFRRPPNRDINPDEVVAIGAAIQGGIIRGDIKDLILLDVTPLSLGIETHGGLFVRLIERNATIPTKNTQIFTTVVDNQDTVDIHVLQGEREIASENRSLGRFELVGIPPAPRGVPQVEVTFAIDSNGIVSVSARDVATNQSQTIQINPAGGLSKEEIERLVSEADQFAQADAQKRELRRIKNRIEGLIYTNDKVLTQFGASLSDKDRRRASEVMLKARMALTSEAKADLETALFDLNSTSRILSELMMSKIGDASGAGGPAADTPRSPDDVPPGIEMPTATKRDYYEALGVERDANEKAIKAAYRKLALQFHPDKNPGDKAAEDRFKEAAEAYAILSDPDKRARYDRFGHQAAPSFEGGFDPSTFGDFSDILGDLFGLGGFGGMGGRGARGGAEPGADLRYDLTIGFEEAAFGLTKKLEVPRLERCDDCGGSGAAAGTKPATCAACGGRGQVRFTQGFFTLARPCPTCRGEGVTIADPCKGCRGEGRVEMRRTLEVKIPAGVDSGARLRLIGEGEHGRRGGPQGDLYVVLAVEPHERFEREATHVHSEVEIGFAQAALGATVEVETLHGAKSLEIPAGTRHGEQFRLKGQGIPRLGGTGRGDHVAHAAIRVPRPSEITDEQRALLEKLAELDGQAVKSERGVLGRVRDLFG